MAKGVKVTKKEQQRKRGRTSQKKGRSWQKFVARILAVATHADEDDVYSNQGGDKGDEDVHRSARMKKAFPFWVECKNTKSLQIPGWWGKLKEDREIARCDDPGIIISKLYGTSEALVTLSLVDFLQALYGPLTTDQLDQIKLALRMKNQ